MLKSAWVVCLCLVACGGSSSSSSVSVSVSNEPAGANCASGGQRIDVKSSSGTSTSYVCNGATSAATVSVANEPAGANCASGGKAITTSSGGSTVTSYVCNGSSGASIVATAEPAGANCVEGGVAITSGSTTSYVCNGTSGHTVTVMNEPEGANCPRGGVVVQSDDNGAPTYLCNGDALAWTSITADTTAQANTAYVSDATTPIRLTLPASATLRVGDEVKVLVHGAGTVAVAPASGQTLQVGPTLPKRWHPVTGGGEYIATSADGKTVLVENGGGVLYTSTDGGLTYPNSFTTGVGVDALSVSADGSKLLATGFGFPILYSTDSGATWTASDAPRGQWASVAASRDGMIVYALNNTSAGLWKSTNGGVNWFQGPSGSAGSAESVATSADGSIVYVVEADGVQKSTDGGVSWKLTVLGSTVVASVRTSDDGSKVFATGNMSSNPMYSTDGGATWSSWPSATVPLAMSGDFSRMVGAPSMVSSDGGATWTAMATSPSIDSYAVSRDGTTIYGISLDHSYKTVWDGMLDVNTSGSLDLVYVGDTTFFVQGAVGPVEDSR